MRQIKKHVVIFAEAVTLAHVARCIVLAKAMCDRNYRVTLVADSRYNAILGKFNFPQAPLNSVSSTYFAQRLAKGLPLYSTKILTDYVKEDLRIMEELQPDFVIGDFRLSLAISSRLTKVPYATITNAYWSPYALIDYPIPELPLTKICGVLLAQKLFDRVRPLVFRLHTLAFNKTCKRFGLPSLSSDLREIYTHADYTLYADIEGIIPMQPLPDNHIIIGPVLWSAEVPAPEWWVRLPADKPIVFVTLGSSGDNSLLPMILEVLSAMPITTIAVTVQQGLVLNCYENVFIADFLSAEAAVKKADIVICNGGSPMVYQSLVENKAIIGVPTNLDQYLMMSALTKLGKGIMIRSGKLDPKRIRNAVMQSLEGLAGSSKKSAYHSKLGIERICALVDSV